MEKNKAFFYFTFFLGFFVMGEYTASFGQETSTPNKTAEDSPIHIEADEMLYSSQQDKAVATGNAWASQRNKKIYADVLIAEFEEVSSAGSTENSSRELQKLYAEGNVRMTTPTEELTGGREAIYTVPTEELLVYGEDILLKGEKGSLRAHEKMIYNKDASHALAYGDVELVMPRKVLKAPFVEAFFMPTDSSNVQNKGAEKKGGIEEESSDLQLKEAYANGGVTIQTPTYVSLSEEAFYNAQAGKADLYGNVKISDGRNTFEGPCGQYDEKTEVSKLVPCSMLQENPKIKQKYKDQSKSKVQEGRIRALLYSKKKQDK